MPSSPTLQLQQLHSQSLSLNNIANEPTIFDFVFDNDLDNDCHDDDELKKYLELQSVSRNINPLKWWHDRKKEFPLMAELALEYLCISATSVPSERLFSDVGNHITKKRNCLSTDSISKLLFLKRNMSVIDIF